MRISQVIASLEKFKARFGDVPVVSLGDVEQGKYKFREVFSIEEFNIETPKSKTKAVLIDS